jgi:prepilin-type N-terminal cleavage/methylation domain-containing protein
MGKGPPGQFKSEIRVRMSPTRLPGLTFWTMDLRLNHKAGFSLTELLCVIAILLILSALYLPAIARAYHRVRTFLGGMGG